jgi:glycosyltransferase involved in cell wall biosynthesis
VDTLRARISAVINTFNEEQNIRQCLECLTWCDEIIIVDMYSEDNTIGIARDYTDKICYFNRSGYVEPARKYAMEQATGDWILLVDADELIPVALKELLIKTISDGDTEVVHIPRKNFIMGEWIKHTGWWPDYQARFFRKGKVAFTDTIHAGTRVLEKAKQFHIPSRLAVGIEHFAYIDSEHFVTKLNRYTTIEAGQMFDQKKKFSLLRMFIAGIRGVQVRYVSEKGYRDGYRGLFLSLMMGFYGALTYMKLWENWQNKDIPVTARYDTLKEEIITGYHGEKR